MPAPAAVRSPRTAEDARQRARDLLSEDPTDLFGLALVRAAEEADTIQRIEAALAAMAERVPLAESYKMAARWTELADLAESVLQSRPNIQLLLLDSTWLQYRLNSICVRFGIYLREAKLALLNARHIESAQEQDIVEQLRIKVANERRELQRQNEVLASDLEPERRAAHLEDPSVATYLDRDMAWRKIQSIKLTCDFANRPLGEAVGFLRDYSGMNIVVRGTDALVPVTVTLRDVTLEGALEHLTASAGMTWELDRFGILTLSPKR